MTRPPAQAANSTAAEAALGHVRDCLLPLLSKHSGYECQVANLSLSSSLTCFVSSSLSVSPSLSPPPYCVLSTYAARLQQLDIPSADQAQAPVLHVQEADGEFMLAYHTSWDACLFCLRVRPRLASCICDHYQGARTVQHSGSVS